MNPTLFSTEFSVQGIHFTFYQYNQINIAPFLVYYLTNAAELFFETSCVFNYNETDLKAPLMCHFIK